jgi:flagellum-specific peptidoglycan hydrolase FlgJ
MYSFWFVLGIALGSGFLYSFKELPQTFIKYKYIVVRDTVPEDIPLTKEAILKELVDNKCVLPAIALAQFSQETEHFKSSICKENKNIAGIRNSSSKYVIGMNRGHCVYKTYKDCIKDYIRIQNSYLKNINKKYAEDTNYINKLKNIKVHLK